jgi:hypothetical protein
LSGDTFKSNVSIGSFGTASMVATSIFQVSKINIKIITMIRLYYRMYIRKLGLCAKLYFQGGGGGLYDFLVGRKDTSMLGQDDTYDSISHSL